MQVGILGIGTYLPDEVRKNDWWPTAYIDAWREKRVNRMTRGAVPNDVTMTPGVKLVLEEMAAMAHDPFDGALERRVMPEGMVSSDMEVFAAQRALAAAGLTAKDVDVMFLQSMATDHILINNASALHDRLGLRQDVLALETQGACNGFLLHLDIAQQMLQSKRSRHILMVQSTPLSRVTDPRDPYSVWYGDGASAVVVGEVAPNRGILGISSRTDGTVNLAMVGAVEEEKPWYEGGTVRLRSRKPLLGRRMLLTSADLGKQALDDVFAVTGLTAANVDFFACHQASSWFRRAAQKLIGLEHTKTVDVFPWAGNLAGACLPLVMEIGVKDHLIKDGDLVAVYGGGAGMTWSAVLLRWGR